MRIGFIGAGNMARSILSGISKSSSINSKDVFVSNRTEGKLKELEKDFSFNVSTDNDYVIKNAKDILFICVKPQVFDTILKDIKKKITKNQLVVSIMAGKTIDYLKKSLSTKNIVRVMPNTPCFVGAGVSAVSADKEVIKNKNYKAVLEIFKSIGEVIEVDEKYINAITQVSGASPAWIFMMIEALADGGVECGLTRDMAYKFATNAVYGAGKLARDKYVESKTHPGVLKDMVTSPAGTTIEGVRVLEENGFRGAIIDAVMQSYSRSLEL